jgi:UDPglucose 6-dehydrogenase
VSEGVDVAVFGLWHLGSVTAACLAELGYRVIGIDQDEAVVDGLSRGRAPLAEPGLDELLRKGLSSGRLRFSADPSLARGAGIGWFTHDVPIDENDESDLSGLFAHAEVVARAAALPRYLVSAQVPVGTTERLAQLLGTECACQVAYVPENLQLGKALERFRNPDFTVVGTDCDEMVAAVLQLLRPIDASPVVCDVRTAEMVKHAINAFLATSISLANELGDIAEQVGADAHLVAAVMRADSRIGKAARVIPGLPFAGGTLARDLRTLQRLGRAKGTATSMCDAALQVNGLRVERLVESLARRVELSKARVAVLGMAYTEGTDTLRRSPGLAVAECLRDHGASVSVYAPELSSAAAHELVDLDVCTDAYDAARNAAALVVMRRGMVEGLRLDRLAQVMNGCVVVDPWSALSATALRECGLYAVVPGRPTVGLSTCG